MILWEQRAYGKTLFLPPNFVVNPKLLEKIKPLIKKKCSYTAIYLGRRSLKRLGRRAIVIWNFHLCDVKISPALFFCAKKVLHVLYQGCFRFVSCVNVSISPSMQWQAPSKTEISFSFSLCSSHTNFLQSFVHSSTSTFINN